MASAFRRITQRTSLASIKSAINYNVRTPSSASATTSTFPTKSTASILRLSFSTRIAPELGCLQSMLPLHSAVAVARMTSCLSTTSRSCRALSRGPVPGFRVPNRAVFSSLQEENQTITEYWMSTSAWSVSSKVTGGRDYIINIKAFLSCMFGFVILLYRNMASNYTQ